MAKIRVKKGKSKGVLRQIEGLYKADFLTETLILDKDNTYFTSCAQCVLQKPSCGDICLCGGPLKHVHRRIKYNWRQICRRYIAHLLYKDYNHTIFNNPFK